MTEWPHHRRAQSCIAQSYLTNSKRPESLVKGIYPTHCSKGKGPFLYDHKGYKYLDFICGLGSTLLGYANPKINAAMIRAMEGGASHSLATHWELEAAEKLKELVPFVDCVKWLKTGTDACLAAVKIARAKTGRSLIVSEGYHGWSDGFVSLTEPHLGVLDSERLEFARLPNAFFEQPIPVVPEGAAAVIVEPISTINSRDRLHWLKDLRAQCTKTGALLIFDEVITGFRWPKFTFSEHSGVVPDLICLGKAIANGMPLACVAGKYDVMNCGEYFVSSTYAGETLSLAAAKEVMTLLQTQHDIDWLWSNGQRFLDEFNGLWPGKISIEGYPSRGIFKGDEMIRALFFQECCRSGLLFGPSFFLSFPAIDELRNSMTAIRAIVHRISRGEVRLDGELPKSPFAQRVRERT